MPEQTYDPSELPVDDPSIDEQEEAAGLEAASDGKKVNIAQL